MFNIILSKKIKLFVVWFLWTISFIVLLPALIDIFLLIFLRAKIFIFRMDFSTINFILFVITSFYGFLFPKAVGRANKIVLTIIFLSIAFLIPTFIKSLKDSGIRLLDNPLTEYTIFFYLSGLFVPLLSVISNKIKSQNVYLNLEEVNNEKKIIKYWKFATVAIISVLLFVYLGLLYLTATMPGFDILVKKCSTVADCPTPPNEPGWKTVVLCENNKCVLKNTQIHPEPPQ